jgi:hypothetical protein
MLDAVLAIVPTALNSLFQEMLQKGTTHHRQHSIEYVGAPIAGFLCHMPKRLKCSTPPQWRTQHATHYSAEVVVSKIVNAFLAFGVYQKSAGRSNEITSKSLRPSTKHILKMKRTTCEEFVAWLGS